MVIATQYDGSIVIDTKLDNTGFERGSKKMEKSVEKLEERINEIGRAAQRGLRFDANNPKNAIALIDRSLKSTVRSLNQMARAAENATSKSEVSVWRLNRAAKELNSRIKYTKEELQKFGGTKFETDAFKKLVKEADKAQAKVKELEGALVKAEEKADAMGDSFMASDEVARAKQQITAMRKLVEQYNDAVRNGKTGLSAMLYTSVDDPKGPEHALEEAERKYEELLEKFGNSTPYRSAQNEVEKLGEKLEEARKRAAELENQLSHTQQAYTGSDTTAFESATAQIEDIGAAAEQLEKIGQSALEFGKVKTEAEEATGKVRAFFDAFMNAGGLSKVALILRSIAKGAVNAAGGLAQMAKHAASGALRGLKSIFDRAAKGLSNFGGAVKKNNGIMNSGLGQLLRYGIGIRSLFALCNKLRSALADGMKNLSAYSPEVNSALASMTGALSTLKNALATAFAPIVTAIAPYVTYLINLLSAAITKIAQFFAAITGRSTYIKAVRAQNGIAGAMASTGAAAAETAEQAKAAEKALASFDNLNILKKSEKTAGSGGGGGGGGGGDGIGDMFTTEDIPSAVADFVEKIKEAFEAGDYTEIGHIIAGKINDAFAALDQLIRWENVKDKITRGVNVVVGAINGLFGPDGVDFEYAGGVLADGVNTLLNTANLLLTGVKWSEIGRAFGTGLNGFVGGIHWDTAAKVMANGVGALIDVVQNGILSFRWDENAAKFARGLNTLGTELEKKINGIQWSSLASTMTTGFNTFIGEIDTTQIGNNIAGVLNGALKYLNTAAELFNWTELGRKIGNFLNGLKIDWTLVGSTLASGLNGAFGTLKSAIDTFDSVQFARELANGFNRWVNEVNWGEVGDTIGSGLASAMRGLAEFLRTLDVPELIQGLSDFIGGLNKDGQLTDAFKDLLGAAFQAASLAVFDTGKGAVDWIGSKIFGTPVTKDTSVWDFLKGGLGAAIKIIQNPDIVKNVERPRKDKDSIGPNPSIGFTYPKRETDYSSIDLRNAGNEIEIKSNVVFADETAQKNWRRLVSKLTRDEVRFNAGADKKKFANNWKKLVSTIKPVAVELKKKGWSTINGFIGKIDAFGVELKKKGWSTITGWVNNFKGLGQSIIDIVLNKSNWANQTTTSWVESPENKGSGVTNFMINLAKGNWSSNGTQEKWTNQFAGIMTNTMNIGLKKHDWGSDTIGGWGNLKANMGEGSSLPVLLKRAGEFANKMITPWAEKWKGTGTTNIGVGIYKHRWSSIFDLIPSVVRVGISLVKSGWSALKTWLFGAASGGGFDRNGVHAFSSGGVISGGHRTWWDSVQKYAGGTSSVHGTAFIAGEAGPEIVGHVGGRTEVLNRSQLASTMHAAVMSALQSLSTVLTNISGRAAATASNTANILNTLADISATVTYSVPVMASGTVMPYEVGTMISRQTSDLQKTLDENNEALMAAFISAIGGQTSALISALQKLNTGNSGGMSADALISEINRRTYMFGASPLKA